MTPLTSSTILKAIRSSRSQGSFEKFAVIASSLSTALTTTEYWYVLWSPMTPTVLTGSIAANACQSFLSSPAFLISSLTIASAPRRISSFSFVTSPGHLTASPGPGKGWRHVISSGMPSFSDNWYFVLVEVPNRLDKLQVHPLREHDVVMTLDT